MIFPEGQQQRSTETRDSRGDNNTEVLPVQKKLQKLAQLLTSGFTGRKTEEPQKSEETEQQDDKTKKIHDFIASITLEDVTTAINESNQFSDLEQKKRYLADAVRISVTVATRKMITEEFRDLSEQEQVNLLDQQTQQIAELTSKYSSELMEEIEREEDAQMDLAINIFLDYLNSVDVNALAQFNAAGTLTTGMYDALTEKNTINTGNNNENLALLKKVLDRPEISALLKLTTPGSEIVQELQNVLKQQKAELIARGVRRKAEEKGTYFRPLSEIATGKTPEEIRAIQQQNRIHEEEFAKALSEAGMLEIDETQEGNPNQYISALRASRFHDLFLEHYHKAE
jgi:hypothetical protein